MLRIADIAYDDATGGTGFFKSQTWDTGLSQEVLSRDAKIRVHELKLKTSASDPGLTFSWDYNADNQLTRESLPQLGGTWGMEWGYYPKSGYGDDDAPAALASVSIRDTLDQTLARVNYTYDSATKRLETITADLLETGIESGARAGVESGATCCQRIAPTGAASNTISRESQLMPCPPPWTHLLPWPSGSA